jgi:hypothetical protein
MTARVRYQPRLQYPPLSVLAGLYCLNKNLGGSFLYKESGERKEGEGKGEE